jgi:hypothetical protein
MKYDQKKRCQKMNQKMINKIIALAIVFLLVMIISIRFTEQKRVEYYICYEERSADSSAEHEVIKEICQERND